MFQAFVRPSVDECALDGRPAGNQVNAEPRGFGRGQEHLPIHARIVSGIGRRRVPATTATALLVPVMVLLAVSVAVSDWLTAVFSVALKDPTPFVNVLSPGSTAWPSLLVKWTVPAYPLAVLLKASRAMAVKVNAVPAVALPGAPTPKCVAGPGLTTMVPLVPVMLLLALSVAVTVRLPVVRRMTMNEPLPLLRVLSPGSVAALSVLVKCTVPV
jgi:hypothetical protein